MNNQSARYAITDKLTPTPGDGTWPPPSLSSIDGDNIFTLFQCSLVSVYAIKIIDAIAGIYSSVNNAWSYPMGGTSIGGAA
ncbi:MAG: hypothetical protein LBI34_00105 [Puniceicoccales bacterium]|jgi:hypothetical protein|nr:hypothetical protein [Puniceicoccales bacterium]